MRRSTRSLPPLRGVILALSVWLAVGAVGCASGETATPTTSTPTTSTTSTSTTSTTGVSTTSTAPAATQTTLPASALRAPIVVVDPGHNGANGDHPEIINRPVDAGGFEKACNTTGAATDQGVTESAINWEAGQLLRERLEVAGIQVIVTRDSDDGVGPCVDERGQTAARAGADLLVSLHADGAPPSGHGFHVIHPAALACCTDATAGPSAVLATDVRDALVAAGFVPSTYVGHDGLDQRDDLGTLNRAGVPAVMVEAGNLSNVADAASLTSGEGQAGLADALTAGILRNLDRTRGQS